MDRLCAEGRRRSGAGVGAEHPADDRPAGPAGSGATCGRGVDAEDSVNELWGTRDVLRAQT